MLYLQIHIGDWVTETRDLTPTEVGVYFDLFIRYISQESPLMRSHCERIARAYSEEEHAALQFVLEKFFTFDGEAYRSEKAEQLIAARHKKCAINQKNAKARWYGNSKTYDDCLGEEKEKSQQKTPMQTQCDRNADAMQTQCDCNANAMLTDNRKPLTDNHKEKENKKKNPPLLKPNDCSQEVFDEWMTYKKQSGGKCTQRMVDAIVREAGLANLTTEGAMVLQMEQGWKGFNAQWATNLTLGIKTNRSVIGPKTLEPDWSKEDYGEIGFL